MLIFSVSFQLQWVSATLEFEKAGENYIDQMCLRTATQCLILLNIFYFFQPLGFRCRARLPASRCWTTCNTSLPSKSSSNTPLDVTPHFSSPLRRLPIRL